MAWVYLDDQFPDHPKVLAAGPAAAWLYVAGLCYCRRLGSPGIIPKTAVPRLIEHRRCRELAAKLVRSGLWSETASDFRVHDWADWNRPADARSAAGRKAAQARWGRTNRNANASSSQGSPQAEDNADGNAIASKSHMRFDAQSHPIPTVKTKSSSNSRARRRAEEDDGVNLRLVDAALAILAGRDLDDRQGRPGLAPIRDVERWTARALADRRRRHESALRSALANDPGLSATELAERVWKGANVHTEEPPSAEEAALAGTQAAARARAEENGKHIRELAAEDRPPPEENLAGIGQARKAMTRGRKVARDKGSQ